MVAYHFPTASDLVDVPRHHPTNDALVLLAQFPVVINKLDIIAAGEF